MAAEGHDVIGIKFGVLGGDSISGWSGAKIKEQLEKIADQILLSVKVQVDEAHFKKQLKSLKTELDNTLGKLEINIKTKKATRTTGGGSDDGAKKEEATYETLRKTLEKIYKLKSQIAKAPTTSGGKQASVQGEINVRELQELEKEYERQKSQLEEIGKKDKKREESIRQQVEEAEKLKQALEEAYKAEQAARSSPKMATETDMAKLKVKAQSLYTDNGFDDVIAKSEEAKKTVDEFNDKVKDALNHPGSLTKDKVAELNAEFLRVQSELKKAQVETDTLGNKIKDAFNRHVIQKIGDWILMFIVNAIRQVYTNVVELDKEITNLQIATGKTRDETIKLANAYAKLAKELGSTVTQATQAANTWLRQGYDVAQTNELITYTMMLSKLGQLDSTEAAKALTSAMKGYKVEVKDSIKIVDKFTAVDMEAAVSAGGLATAMAETAVSANTTGVSMDRLIGYIASVAEVTQDGAESVGTFFKTMFARMSNIKAGKFVDDETGEELNDVAAVLSKVGVSLFDVSGQFRNFEDVLEEVGKKWEQLDSKEKAAIATAMAGTRQQEKFKVLMENYANAMEYAGVSAASGGTATSKFNAAYLDSIEAKINTLIASWQEFSQNILDSAIVKTFVTILTFLANALNFFLGHFNTTIALVPILTTLLGKLSIKAVTGFTKWIKSITTVNKRLKEAKARATEAGEAVQTFVNNKGGSRTVDDVNQIYEASRDTTDQVGYIQRTMGLTKNDAQELVDLKIKETAAQKQLAAVSKEHQQAAMLGLNAAVSGVTILLGYLSGIERTGGNIATLVVAGIAAIGVAFTAFFVHMKAEAWELSVAEKTSVILTLISVGLTIVMAIISAIKSLVGQEGKAKESAKENAKATQDEADKLRDLSKAAKEASDNISNLSDEINGLNRSMNNLEWYNYLDKLGQEINNLYGDEELSSLQAINKLLGQAYTYDELMRMSAQERLDLLDQINKASIEETRSQQKSTYELQRRASKEMTDALGMREKIKTKGHPVIQEFLDSIYAGNDEGIVLDNTGGKNFKVTINSSSASDFVNKVEKITKAYEEQYKYNIAALQDNEIYRYFAKALEEGKKALQSQTSDALKYLNSTVQSEALDIKVNLNASDLQAEYERVIKEITDKVKSDSTIDAALTEGIISSEHITEYATSFIATHYKDLYNAVNKTLESVIVPLKSLTNMLDETENQFDLLGTAMEEMNKRGILSADTIRKLKDEFPELLEYVNETANGFTLMDGALSSYLNKISASYMASVKSAQDYFDTVYKAYEASAEKTLEEYKIVIEARDNLNRAIQNAENWRITEATLSKDKLMEQYTDLLEKQKDVLGEQIDKYKELCDIRRDLLSTYQDELDYQRQLAQKTKSLADLQTQLAMAKLDTSAKGKAKARELEQQVKEAQDELDEFTLEHAVETITASISNEESEYESFIQGQIDEIKETIENAASMTANAIAQAVTAMGEKPVALDTSAGGTTSTSGEYASTIESGKASAEKAISEATTAPSPPAVTAPKTQGFLPTEEGKRGGKNTYGKVNIQGFGTTDRKNNDIDVSVDGVEYDLLMGELAAQSYVIKLDEMTGYSEGNRPSKATAVYDGGLFIVDHKGKWRQMLSDHSDVGAAVAAYLRVINGMETHHTGGFAGDATDLRSNEVFAKLLRGEFVSTPAQMDNFINKTLPAMIGYAVSGGANITYNSPLVEISCGNIDEQSMPTLRDLVNEAVKKIETNMESALRRTGYKKQF